jgi:NAD(P)-dependent dehydrogenase (short-subunit alcohol dehydrogenase family)
MTTDESGSSTTRARFALVTGANKGIGKAIAAGLAGQGFTVYLGSRDIGRGQAAATELATAGDVRAVTLDVTSDTDAAGAVSRLEAEAGYLDVLVNNAGTHPLISRPGHLPAPAEETADDLRYVYETNVFAVVRLTNAFLPLLQRAPAARIVNLTSKRGSIGEEGAWAGQPVMSYSSSKTALNAITVHYARALAGTPIKVNGAAPGHVATDFNNFRGSRTPEQGAAVAIHLATLPADGPTGTVFEDHTQLAW